MSKGSDIQQLQYKACKLQKVLETVYEEIIQHSKEHSPDFEIEIQIRFNLSRDEVLHVYDSLQPVLKQLFCQFQLDTQCDSTLHIHL